MRVASNRTAFEVWSFWSLSVDPLPANAADAAPCDGSRHRVRAPGGTLEYFTDDFGSRTVRALLVEIGAATFDEEERRDLAALLKISLDSKRAIGTEMPVYHLHDPLLAVNIALRDRALSPEREPSSSRRIPPRPRTSRRGAPSRTCRWTFRRFQRCLRKGASSEPEADGRERTFLVSSAPCGWPPPLFPSKKSFFLLFSSNCSPAFERGGASGVHARARRRRPGEPRLRHREGVREERQRAPECVGRARAAQERSRSQPPGPEGCEHGRVDVRRDPSRRPAPLRFEGGAPGSRITASSPASTFRYFDVDVTRSTVRCNLSRLVDETDHELLSAGAEYWAMKEGMGEKVSIEELPVLMLLAIEKRPPHPSPPIRKKQHLSEDAPEASELKAAALAALDER